MTSASLFQWSGLCFERVSPSLTLSTNVATGGTHLASLTIISLTTGDVSYLECMEVHWAEARSITPQQNVLTVLEATGVVLVRDALPIRTPAAIAAAK